MRSSSVTAKKGAKKGPDCNDPTCMARTTGGKPYCSDHLYRMPYVALNFPHMAGPADEREDSCPGRGNEEQLLG